MNIEVVMYVRNRIGFNFAFKYRGNTITIPYDGKIYSIPNDVPRFKELSVIMPMHIKTQEVIYVKVDGTLSPNLPNHKRSGRPLRKDKYDRTGKRRARKGNVKHTDKNPVDVNVSETVDDVSSVVDIDLDSLMGSTSASTEQCETEDIKLDNKTNKPKTTKSKTKTKTTKSKTKTKTTKSKTTKSKSKNKK